LFSSSIQSALCGLAMSRHLGQSGPRKFAMGARARAIVMAAAAVAELARAAAHLSEHVAMDIVLGADDECDASDVDSGCGLNALQLRGLKQRAAVADLVERAGGAEGDECATAVEGEECYSAVRYFMSKDFFENMKDYPNLNVRSTFEDFQAEVHIFNSSACPLPPCAAAPVQCEHVAHGTPCYEAAAWARADGIWANPDWYPELQAGASSIQGFQAHIHVVDPTLCPLPCFPTYEHYSTPTYRSQPHPIRGISYGPAPLKVRGAPLLGDDFMADIPAVMWADWGRGDLDTMKKMGANTVRLYGNNPNESHRAFLDEAMAKGMDVIVGQSDWPFIQALDACMRSNWYCYNQVYDSYSLNLARGFLLDGNRSYHPALKAVILLNEPDLKVHPRQLTCRAVASAFDAVLQAEKDLGVTGNPVAFTATFSFGLFDGKAPALGQMQEFYECLKDVHAAPTTYTPRNDLLAAYKARWVNSFNTANPAPSLKELTLNKYGAVFWNDEVKIPLFIGEYHSVYVDNRPDLKEMVGLIHSAEYPFFMGFSFFEFSVRYDKGGTEEAFGMFGYDNCALAHMNYSGQVTTVWGLTLVKDRAGDYLSEALAAAYGGESNVLSKALYRSHGCI